VEGIKNVVVYIVTPEKVLFDIAKFKEEKIKGIEDIESVSAGHIGVETDSLDVFVESLDERLQFNGPVP
jgi:hypothetical protein